MIEKTTPEPIRHVPQRIDESDRYFLEESAKIVLGKLLTDFPDSLPDGILYPDVSARPLFYLLSPALEVVSRKRGVKKPYSYFFKIHSTHPAFTRMNHGELSHGLPFAKVRREREFQLRNLQEIRKYSYNPLTKFKAFRYERWVKKSIELDKEALNTVDAFRYEAEERAMEILAHLERSGIGDPTLITVDDFASNSYRATREIRRAFGLNIPTYSLLVQEELAQAHDSDNFSRFGLVTPYEDEELNMAYSFNYLNYREVLGYTKDVQNEIWSAPTAATIGDRQAMRQLRREMTEIGQKIASTITFSQEL